MFNGMAVGGNDGATGAAGGAASTSAVSPPRRPAEPRPPALGGGGRPRGGSKSPVKRAEGAPGIWSRSSTASTATGASDRVLSAATAGAASSASGRDGFAGMGPSPALPLPASAGSDGMARASDGGASARMEADIDEEQLYGSGSSALREVAMQRGLGGAGGLPPPVSRGSSITSRGTGLDDGTPLSGRTSSAERARIRSSGSGGGRSGSGSRRRRGVDPLAAGGDFEQAEFEADLDSFLSRPPPAMTAFSAGGPSLPKLQDERRKARLAEYGSGPQLPKATSFKSRGAKRTGSAGRRRGPPRAPVAAQPAGSGGGPLDMRKVEEAFRYADGLKGRINSEALMSGADVDAQQLSSAATSGRQKRSAKTGGGSMRRSASASAKMMKRKGSGTKRRPASSSTGEKRGGGGAGRRMKRTSTGSKPRKGADGGLRESDLYGGSAKVSSERTVRKPKASKADSARKANYEELVERFSSGAGVEELRKQLAASQRSLQSSESFIRNAQLSMMEQGD